MIQIKNHNLAYHYNDDGLWSEGVVSALYFFLTPSFSNFIIIIILFHFFISFLFLIHFFNFVFFEFYFFTSFFPLLDFFYVVVV